MESKIGGPETFSSLTPCEVEEDKEKFLSPRNRKPVIGGDESKREGGIGCTG